MRSLSLLSLLALTPLLTAPAPTAHTANVSAPLPLSCILPTEMGGWTNADPNTRSLTHIELRFVCQDQILNGELYPPGPAWYVHILGKCSPTDCDWGEVGARRLESDHIFATYDHGFARRYVYARMSQYRPGQLWVYTYTDFVSPSRPDYAVHNWFTRD